MKVYQKKQSFILKVITKYYAEEIHRLLHLQPRDKKGFSILIGIRYLLIFIFSISPNLQTLVNADVNFSFLSSYGIVGYLERNEVMQSSLYFFICTNALLVLYFCLNFCIYYFNSQENKKKLNRSMNNLGVCYSIEEGFNVKTNLADKAFSLFITLYQHCIYVPSVFFSFKYIDQTISAINLVLSIFINLIISDCDYNYELKQVDFLARPFSSVQLLFHSIVEILIMLAIAFIPKGKSVITASYYLINGLITHIFSSYYNKFSQFVFQLAVGYFFCCSLIVEIGISFSIPNRLISLFLFIFYPICYSISTFLANKTQLKTVEDLQNIFDEQHTGKVNLDRIIRLNLFGQIVNSLDYEKRELKILSLIINSPINLWSSSFNPNTSLIDPKNKGFLQKQKNLQYENENKKREGKQKRKFEESIDETTGNAIIKQRMKQILKEQFKYRMKEFNKNKDGVAMDFLSFFIFLIEISESYRMYWLLFLELMASHRLTIKQLQLLNSIHSIFLKKRYIMRKTIGKSNPFDTSYLEVILFENRLEQSYNLFEESIKQKLEILNVMKYKEIAATQLTAKIEKMQTLLYQLKKNLNSLCSMNDDSLDLLNIQALYLENLAFNEKDINLMQINKYRKKHSSQMRHRYLSNTNDDDIQSSSIHSDIFDEKTCILFTSYKDSRSLVIKAVSQNFQDVFQYTTNKDIIGHNIESIIPVTFQPYHKKYLESYLEEEITTNINDLIVQQKSQQNQNGEEKDDDDRLEDNEAQSKKGVGNQVLHFYKKGCRMNQQIIFSQQSSLFILPVMIDIRINQFYDNDNSFGLTAKIKQINHQYEYILYDERTLNILGLTEKLHFTLFPQCEQLSKLNIKKTFPFLIGSFESNLQNTNNDIDQESQHYHINLTKEMEEILKESKIKRKTEYKRRKIAFIIIQHEDFKDTLMATTILSKKQKSIKQKSINPFKSQTLTKPNVNSYNFFYVELTLNQVKYRGIENISYIEIQKLRQLNPNDQAPFILQQIKHLNRFLIYDQLFTNANELEGIISNLEQKAVIIQYQQQNISQLNTSQLVASGLNVLNIQNISNNQISTTGSSINNIQAQQLSGLNVQQSSDKLIQLIDDSSNVEQVKMKLSHFNQEIINEQQEDDNSQTSIEGYDKIEIKRKSNFGVKLQSENNDIILQQQQNIIQYNQDDYILHDLTHNPFDNQAINKSKIYNLSNINLLNNKHNQNDKSQQQDVSSPHIYYQTSYNLHRGLDDDTLQHHDNHIQNDQSLQEINKQDKFQQRSTFPLISPSNIKTIISEDKKVNLPFNSPSSSSVNMIGINLMESGNQQQLTTVLSYQDLKLFSPRISIQSRQNLMLEGTQNNNQQTQGNGFDVLLSPVINEEKISKLELEIDQKPTDTKQAQTKQNNKYESLLAHRQTHYQNKNKVKVKKEQYESTNQSIGRDDEYYSKDDKAQRKKKVQNIQFDIASTNSRESSSASAKRQLQQIMADKSILQIIKAINIIGIMCFSVMICVTWVQYVQLNQQLTSAYLDYQVFNWPTKYEATLSQILKNQNILYLTQYSKSLKFTNQNQYYAFRNTTQSNKFLNRQIVNSMIIEMESANTDRQIFSLLRNHYLIFLFGQYYNITMLTKTSSVPSSLVAVSYNTTAQYSTITAWQYLFRYTAGLGNGRPEYYTIANQLSQISSLKSIQNQQMTNQQDKETSIRTQLANLMILIIVINGVCVSIIIPLYYHIQRERDVIIQLFATFPTYKIDQLITSIQKSYFNQKSKSTFIGKNSQSLKQTLVSIQNSQKEKDFRKQNISTMTKLPRFNLRIVALVVIIYILVICYPIIIKVVTTQYLSKSTLDLQTMTTVYQLRSYLLENIAMHMNVLVMKINPTLKPMNVSIYYDYVNNLNKEQQQMNDDMQWVVNQEYESTRYSQSLYESFFFRALQNNLCDVFNDYPQYNTNSTVLNTTICETTYSGFLKKGLQVSYKQILTLFPTLYNYYIMPDPVQSLASINQFLSTFNIQDFVLFTEFLDQVIISLTEFVLDQNRDYYNNIMIFQVAMICYQMVLMFLVFTLGWIAFSEYLNRSLHRTKTYLQIIDINTLIENTYILTYIKKNSIL